jgi:tetratricopeptide (TPR) repeat protein
MRSQYSLGWRCFGYKVITILALASFATILLGLAMPTIRKVNTQSYLDAGRAHMKVGEYEKAAHSFRQYTELRPDNPLGYLELGFALSQICGKHPCPEAIEATHKGGMISERLTDFGDAAFEAHKWADAFVGYQRALLIQHDSSSTEVSLGLTLRIALSAALAQAPEAPKLIEDAQHLQPQFTARRLSRQEEILLSASDFFWILPLWPPSSLTGKSLQYQSPPGLGTFWWSLDAGALIHVDEPGHYVIKAHLRHAKPSPIEMAIGINRTKLNSILLSRGDDSWETVKAQVELKKGYQLVNLFFLNDGYENGLDRNAQMEWVKIYAEEQ